MTYSQSPYGVVPYSAQTEKVSRETKVADVSEKTEPKAPKLPAEKKEQR